LSQIFLIDTKDARAIGQVMADVARFGGVFRVEEVYEFCQCRADWLEVKKEVEKVMFGLGGCVVA